MPNLTPVVAMMDSIAAAVKTKADKSKLLMVSKFEAKAKQLPVDQFSWMFEEEDFGNSPIVSSMQASPIVGQGDYSQYIASGIETRHVKMFTREQLQKIMSPDKVYQVDAARHIERESLNQVNRVYSTIELVGQSLVTRGVLKYVSNDAGNRMNVNISIPIKTKTASATWATTSNDVIGMVQAWLDEFSMSGQGVPDVMRMTTKVWRTVRDNAAIKTYVNAVLRMNPTELTGAKGSIISAPMVSAALGWPQIEIYDERASLQFTSGSTGAKNGTRTINLNEGTFGLNVGDTVLIRYNKGSWDNEAKIASIVDGVSVNLVLPDADSAAIAVGDNLVCKPTYFPEDRVLFIADELTDIEMVRLPFGISASGSNVQLTDEYGVKLDVFEGTQEPGLVVYRRIRDKFGWRCNPRKIMSCKVIL
jgi:hypothetical protein